MFASIDAVVSAKGGVLQKVTAHLDGSDMLIYFGVPDAHTDDASRAASAAIAIRDIIAGLPLVIIAGEEVKVSCQIGLSRGRCLLLRLGNREGAGSLISSAIR